MTRIGRCLLGVAVAWLVSGVGATARPLFPHPAETCAWDPRGLVPVDLDGDGKQELVAVNEFDGLRIYETAEDGAFVLDTIYGFGNSRLSFVVVGDFDENGVPDLAISARYSEVGDDVTVLLGDGQGGFSSIVPYFCDDGLPGGCNLTHIALGHFNNDAHQDLLTMGDTAMVLLGDGQGGFSTGTAPGGQYFAAVADLDGDGLDDYVHGDEFGSTVTAWLGQGDGTFLTAGSSSVGDWPRGIAAADVDQDQIPDLVVANRASHDLSLLIGNGDGTFGAEQRLEVVPGSPVLGPFFVVVEDVDGDGLLDIAVDNISTTQPNPTLALLPGTGPGQFGPAVTVDTTDVVAYSFAFDDLDGDGVKDLVRGCDNCGMVTWDYGVGDGSNPQMLYESISDVAWSLAVGDLDGDGRADLVATNGDAEEVSVRLANGAATFAPEQRFCTVDALPPCPVGDGASSVAIAELTGDAHLDLAVGTLSGEIVVLAGDGAGNFSFLTAVALPTSGSFVELAVGDLDNDTDADLVAVMENFSRLIVYLGNGDGSFAAPATPPSILGTEPTFVALALLDGDAHLDAVVANALSDNVTVLLGAGNGRFTGSTLPAGDQPLSVLLEDLDGDSIVDLLVANRSSNDLWLRSGVGDGSFSAEVIFPYGDPAVDFHGPNPLQAVDLDGDGLLDLAAGGIFQTTLFFGHGDGTFDRRRRYLTHIFSAAVDVDLDDRPDLIGLGFPDEVSISLNQSGPSALSFADDETLSWPSVLGAVTYDLYRGPFSSLVDIDDDGLADGGYGVCMTGFDDDARDTYFVDATLPSTGDGFFYLRSSITAGGETGLGESSSALTRLAVTPCP